MNHRLAAALVVALGLGMLALAVAGTSLAARPKVTASAALYDARCGDAYRAVRWYRTRYNDHRRTLGFSLAPPVEQAANCRRLRERARYWTTAAAVNRVHAARVTSRRNAVVRLLNRGLAGSPMAGTGRELEAAGRAHGVHPALIAAIAGTESSFGKEPCASNRFNAYGLANCQGIWHVPDFRSWADSYRFMAGYLADRWPHADTTMEFYGYAACDACWGRKVAMWMRSRFGVGPFVRYRG